MKKKHPIAQFITILALNSYNLVYSWINPTDQIGEDDTLDDDTVVSRDKNELWRSQELSVSVSNSDDELLVFDPFSSIRKKARWDDDQRDVIESTQKRARSWSKSWVGTDAQKQKADELQ